MSLALCKQITDRLDYLNMGSGRDWG